MAWAGQTWVEFLQESTYGQFNSGGATFYPRLFGGNSFTPRRAQLRQVIRTADAGNRRIQLLANRRVFAGTLNTLLYPTQGAYLATMFTPVSSVLPSYSVQYWDSVQAWRLLGGVAKSLTITSSAEQDYVTASIEFIFQDRDASFTVFAQPSENVYPTEVPYSHVDTASNCTMGGVAFTDYKNITLKVANVLAPTWNELRTISRIYYCGRDLDFSFGPEYLATTYRTQYESQTALAFVLEWVRLSGSHNITFQLNSSSYESNVGDDLPLDGPGYQNIDVEVFFDKTAASDFVVTAN